MIAVLGGAGITVRVRMIPQEEEYESPVMGDVFDYGTLNVAAKVARGDEIVIENSGSAFNIACHLADMGRDVAFASVVADDAAGRAVLAQLKKSGIDTSCVQMVEGSTPAQVEMLNVLNDPQMVFGNSKLYEAMTADMAARWTDILDSAEAIVIDGSLPGETLEYITSKYAADDGRKLFFDPADHAGAVNAKDLIGRFYCVMPGRAEAEAMLRKTVLSADQLMEAGAALEEKGVRKTVITIKGGGLYYKAGLEEGILAPERVLSFAATSGAGDVVSAAVVAADLEGKTMEETGAFAMKKAAEFLEGRSDERLIDKLNEKTQEVNDGR